MGAGTFMNRAKGATPRLAFAAATEEARYLHGHGGYSGTLAEKHSYVVISREAGETPEQTADRLMDEDDPRISDKWGPAGCIEVGPGEYLFFGWASS